MTRPYFDMVLTGKKMRSIRKSRHISVEQVRDYMGFESVQSIYKWERGECYPQADTLIALCMLYQINPVELFEEDAKASSFHFLGNSKKRIFYEEITDTRFMNPVDSFCVNMLEYFV